MAAKAKTVKKTTKSDIVSAYMEHVLMHGAPQSVFSFCKENEIEESVFYQSFGSLEGLKKGIWVDFYTYVEDLLAKNSDYEAYSSREKLLTFYFTFFEMLTANRSYVLWALHETESRLENLKQLGDLRKKVVEFGKELVSTDNEEKKLKITKKPVALVGEATWVQFLFLLKFWKDDESAGFQKTDVAIEKSVHTVFDIFDNTPLDNILDLGKFLWKERMA
ncbi:TetR family transcriptional regulator C-terminal domain-containing protein [Aquimarina agarilytica]|uniref:TetR family transcriptional regulator C-terminal domain-containing protein n=1 Tax=Aquimarina agarilytica TaxID=1087449 RepID=UPI000288F32A|nr:TetR family transcriptional regulator C-terminal domain-containing protein [Aquimarina agarilytica]